MSYLVVCTFDLKNASRQDYENAYADLKKLGMERVVMSDKNKPVVIPTTTVSGEFEGDSAGTIRDNILEKVRRAFSARGFSSEIFIVVGGNWAWGGAST
jgi:hypothetical protein